MDHRKLIDELVAPYSIPSRGEFAPAEGKPVCSIVVVDDVEPESSYGVFERAVYAGDPPPGRLARIVARRGRDVISFTAWETLESGRSFFENVVAAQVTQLAIENDVRRDLTRNEYRLLAAIPGYRAGDLVAGGPGPPAGAVVDLMRLRYVADSGERASMREAVDRLALIGRSLRFQELRETSLMLEIGCVTADGFLIAYLHADSDAATEFFEHTIHEITAETFGDWPKAIIEVERYEAMRATIAESILAA